MPVTIDTTTRDISNFNKYLKLSWFVIRIYEFIN